LNFSPSSLMRHPTILACTDGSVYARSVYDHAVWTATRLSAHLRVLHLIDTRHEATEHLDLSGSIGLDARQRLKADLVALDEARGRAAQAKAAAILEDARARLRALRASDFTVEARHGRLPEAIEEYAATAEIVVVGKRGEAADFERLHLGANLERMIRACRHPILVTSRAFQPIGKVLVAYDGGPSARKALDYLLASPLLLDLELHLVAVGRPHPKIAEDLGATAARCREAGFPTVTSHLEGHPEEVFSEYLREHGIDLLVMGAYGHSRIRQFIVGSTTTTMVRTCRVPVLLFR
jgi:nucleotide-binding universal stress UspA family protein